MLALLTPPPSLQGQLQIADDDEEGDEKDVRSSTGSLLAGGTVARAGYEALGASSVDFNLWFDIPGDDWPTAHKVRDKVIIGILRRFAAEGISIPYPTQTTYTADPSGKLIMPYPEVQPVRRLDKEAGER